MYTSTNKRQEPSIPDDLTPLNEPTPTITLSSASSVRRQDSRIHDRANKIQYAWWRDRRDVLRQGSRCSVSCAVL